MKQRIGDVTLSILLGSSSAAGSLRLVAEDVALDLRDCRAELRRAQNVVQRALFALDNMPTESEEATRGYVLRTLRGYFDDEDAGEL